jgi:hypothetical protein
VLATPFSSKLQARALDMLKDVDFVPESPQRELTETAQDADRRLHHRRTGSKAASSSLIGEKSVLIESNERIGLPVVLSGGGRTTEEKKKILGTMLGNVDALVESVTKAGIWGLG